MSRAGLVTGARSAATSGRTALAIRKLVRAEPGRQSVSASGPRIATGVLTIAAAAG